MLLERKHYLQFSKQKQNENQHFFFFLVVVVEFSGTTGVREKTETKRKIEKKIHGENFRKKIKLRARKKEK